MKNLLQSIKPKYIKLINQSDYKFTSTRIIAKLESSKFYGERSHFLIKLNGAVEKLVISRVS